MNAFRGFKINHRYVFLISTLGIMVGGFISGLVGPMGAVLMGMLLGMLGHESQQLVSNNEA